MSSYPWSILGLDAAAGEREIRSAYARRLKLVRPDRDPVGFQKLVEARGVALELARSHVANALEAGNGDEADERWSEVVFVEPKSEAPLPILAPTRLTPDPAARPAATGVVDLASTSPTPATGEPPVATVAPSVSIALDAPNPVFAPATGEQQTTVSASGGMESQAVPLEAVLLEPDAILARLRSLFSAMGPEPAPAEAAHVLNDLERLPRSIRQMIEQDVLKAMARALPAPVKNRFPRLSATLRRLYLIPDTSVGERALSETRRSLFVALDETFGWTTSDRRVHQCLPPGQATQLIAHLQASHSEQRIAREGLPRRWDGDGLPNLDATDLRVFFGSELATYGAAYHEAKRTRAWAPNWRPWLLLFAPVWMLPLRQYRLLGAWLGALLISGIALSSIEANVIPTLVRHFPRTGAGLAALVNIIAFAPVIALHVYVARNNVRLEVEKLARLATKADRKSLFDPHQRASFFRRRAPDFRFADGMKKSSGFWDNWWWIFVGIAVMRLIGMMLK